MDVMKIPKQKWETMREAYCDGFNDGIDSARVSVIKLYLVAFLSFIIGICAAGVI